MSDPRPCPICGKPASAEHRPFCSLRCADVDLNRWLTGGYSIGESHGEEELDPAPSPPPEEA
jgi:hypothetical protein